MQFNIVSDNDAQSQTVKLVFEHGTVLVKLLPDGMVCEIQNQAGDRVIGSWASNAEIALGKPLPLDA